MKTIDEANEAERQPGIIRAVCWECGNETDCYEYIVCCSGKLYHICPECESKLDDDPELSTIPLESQD